VNDPTFLDLLREAEPGKGRGNEELVRAVVPLLQQLAAVHERGRVGPLDDLEELLAVGGALWFHADRTREVRRSEVVETIREASGSGVDVVGRGQLDLDLDARTRTLRVDIAVPGAPITRPVYVPRYGAWELEVGHHDALTDVFLVGMVMGSLATGLDFTDPSDLERFVVHRHRLPTLAPSLHPVLARAIVRMTELDRHARVQDVESLVQRLQTYRDVDERVDQSLDFAAIEGFATADRRSRRALVQGVLQTRLFDLSRRNRLIHHRPTLQMLDLTMASVPQRLSVDTIDANDLFLWDGEAGRDLAAGRGIRLDRYLRFEDAPWIKGALDRIRSEDRRSRTEIGFSQLRLVIAFLNWHDLAEDRDTRIRSPLLLLPVELTLERGVRNSYRLAPRSEVAEVNPVLRHLLAERYALDLPEQIDLQKADVTTFHRALAAAIQRSEPAITLHRLVRPQIRMLRETARRRTDRWRRRSRVTGRGIRTALGVDYSYSPHNFRPLGQQLYLQRVKPERFELEEHLRSARPVLPTPNAPEAPGTPPPVEETSRQVYQHVEAASGPYDWAVDLTHCTLGNFNYRKMSLVRDYDRMLEEGDGVAHPAFDTLFSLEARDTTAPPTGGDPLELFTVVPADPSQAAAVRWARTGRSLIIQGPPGTGKSQTITNLIADSAARGQRVLFVCQKRAALDVVYHRLAQHGLDTLSVIIHDASADKRGFIEDLKAQYTAWTADRAWPDPEPVRDALVEELAEHVGRLERFAAGMRGPVAGGETPVLDVLLESLVQERAPELPAADVARLPCHRDWMRDREAVHEAARLSTQAGGDGILAHHPLRFVAVDVLDAADPQQTLRTGLADLQERLAEARAAWTTVKPGATSADLAEALALLDSLAPLLPHHIALLDPTSAVSLELQSAQQALAHAVREQDRAAERATHWQDRLPPQETSTALATARRFDAMFFLFRWFFPAFWTLRALVAKRYDLAAHAVVPTYTAVLEGLDDLHVAELHVEERRREARERFGFTGSLAAFLLEVERCRSPAGRTPLQSTLAAAWARDPSVVRDLLAARTSIEAVRTAAARLFDRGGQLSLDALDERIRTTLPAVHELPNQRAALKRLQDLTPAVREAVLGLPLAPGALDAAVTSRALDQTWSADPRLARFDRQVLRDIAIALDHGHDRLLDVTSEVIRARVRQRFQDRLAAASRPTLELDEEELAFKQRYTAGRRLLEREFEKVMRHRSIRELSSGASGEVVYDLKPIWLMSPLSISDTLPMAADRFDLVVFDEASQIPLEEAVPAVYRAPQMIVVGDEMQLPPTAFFTSRQSTDDADLDPELAEVHYDLDAESFLSHAARCLPSTMLSWHYRSRHEGLIRFSNEAFYGGRLLTIPDRLRGVERDPIDVPDAASGDRNAAHVLDRPVSWHRLVESPYVKRTNPGEAAYIAQLVRALLRDAPTHTLGIVAFSEAQQGEIERALDALGEEDPTFRRALDVALEREDDGQLVGLFVKNLENVQGDERDIIVLSVCYGPDPSGRMRMNFGPINKGGGEKRLNVVFSRARQHMAVVASIEPRQITNTYNDGANCLRRYLQYAEASSVGDEQTLSAVTAALRPSTPPPAVTPHAVVDALAAALEDADLVVERAVGTSTFQIDLAVGRDDEEVLSVAVLVDGDGTWADGAVFERLHTRPAVLRAFGWTVVPVLTKDWANDRQGCVDRILAAVDDPGTVAFPPPPRPDPVPVAAPDGPVEDVTDEPITLDGAVLVLTGSFAAFTRKDITARLEAAGARVAKGLTRRTTLVVVGTRPGAVLHRAQERGIRRIDEATLLAALGSPATGA
jgi:hypothetical protein